MKITKQQVLSLYEALIGVSHLSGAKFAYAVAKNLVKIKSEVEALEKAHLPFDDFKVYDVERIKLCEEYAIKVDGKPQMEMRDGTMVYKIEDQEAFDKALKELQAKHQDAYDKRQKQLEELNEMLKDEVEVDLHTILPEYIPQNITATQLADLMPMIDEVGSVA